MKKLIVLSITVFAITVSLTSCDPVKKNNQGEPAPEAIETPVDTVSQPGATAPETGTQDTVTQTNNN